MNACKLFQKASITLDGSILLGKHVACDAFQKGRSIAVFTHIHTNHVVGFGSALGAGSVVVSFPTRDLLVAIEGKHLLRRTNFIALDWKTPLVCDEETVTLYPAKHILGSSQVLVEDKEGYRLVYTGDFDSNTEPVEADVLVVDATYGISNRNYTMSDLVEEMVNLIRRRLIKGEPVYLFAATGTIQDIMETLRRMEINVPFISTSKQLRVTQVYEKYYGKVGNYFPTNSMEAWEMMRREDPYVAFYPIGSRPLIAEKYLKIKATAYAAHYPIFMIEKNHYVVALSAHADFEGTLEYVRQSNPKLVITDGSRSGDNAILLAQTLRKELNLEVRAMS